MTDAQEAALLTVAGILMAMLILSFIGHIFVSWLVNRRDQKTKARELIAILMQSTPDKSITSTVISENAITSTKIKDGAITYEKFKLDPDDGETK